MLAECKTNEAFEDSLTTSQGYLIKELKGGSILITNDKGEQRWYGRSRFDLKPL